MSGLLDLTARHGQVFGGSWRASAGGTLEVTEPATGQVLATVGRADASDIDAAVRCAVAAQPGWAARPATERGAVLRAAAQLLERHRDEIAGWLVREGGAVRAKADFEVRSALDELWVAADLPTRPHGELLPAAAGGRSVARRVPLGVVAVISPWNFPLVLSMRAVAPALALGNAVVVKPDAHTAVSGGVVLGRLFEEAGLPAGVLHVMAGDAGPGAALAGHPDVAAVAFTGSTAVGRTIGETAGRGLKRALLELGGNNALIVLDDADLDAAASAGAWGAFFHQGQICMAAGRHIVHAAVFDDYVDKLVARAEKLTVGDPWADDVALGPLISERQLDRVERIVGASLAAGATVRTGGTHDGLFYRPTVLTEVTTDMPVFTEEIFGPVAPVIPARDDDEAVAIANRTEYGLVAAVQTGSARRGLALADRLRTGIVHVNDQTVNDDAYVSFGGWGCSGNGVRYGASHSLDEFTRWQWLTVKDRAPRFPF